jgi:hypothetical protein
MDQPPVLGPGQLPSPEELYRLAVDLLRELAQHDPKIAEKARARGIELDPVG